jgi:hypothetical protein
VLSAGPVVWLDDESQMDAVTAVSGSGPAYFFLLVEALEDAGAALGLPRGTARLLAVHTALGAGRMAPRAPIRPNVLREQVTSRGGTTAAALAVLEAADMRGIFARRRSRRPRGARPSSPRVRQRAEPMAALLFILDALLTLVVIAFLLRLLLPMVRADLRNPIGQAVLKLTSPLVMPLRRLLRRRAASTSPRSSRCCWCSSPARPCCASWPAADWRCYRVLAVPCTTWRNGAAVLLRGSAALRLLSWIGPGGHGPGRAPPRTSVRAAARARAPHRAADRRARPLGAVRADRLQALQILLR